MYQLPAFSVWWIVHVLTFRGFIKHSNTINSKMEEFWKNRKAVRLSILAKMHM